MDKHLNQMFSPYKLCPIHNKIEQGTLLPMGDLKLVCGTIVEADLKREVS